MLTTQSVIWVLAMYKRNLIVRDGWGRTPIVRLVTRDGALVFVVICG